MDTADCSAMSRSSLLVLLCALFALPICLTSGRVHASDLSSVIANNLRATATSATQQRTIPFADNNSTAHTARLRKRTIGPMHGSTGSSSGLKQQFLLGKITEADLLPFTDFVVRQPAFADIMKSWPPTTRAAIHSAGAHWLQQQQRQQQHKSSGPVAAGSPPGFFERWTAGVAQREADGALVRNHLNEDFDDTIVTADESFEQDQLAEPPTWINYLGELGDFIYAQLRQFYELSPKSPFVASDSNKAAGSDRLSRFEAIDDLLDDFYYDQYENSQVLYYGPQLVHEGDMLEIGCYMPNEQPAEWTKSGKALTSSSLLSNETELVNTNPLRVIKRSNYLGAKQNYSLKIFEAQLSDSGNYRCNRMSRKYHKLIVVPAKISAQRLYLIQQKLLAAVAPGQAAAATGQIGPSAQQLKLAALAPGLRPGPAAAVPANKRRFSIEVSGQSSDWPTASSNRSRQPQQSRTSNNNIQISNNANKLSPLLPGHLIIENQPLIVACNISDDFILRRLREQPDFQLAWYKNGRLLRQSQARTSQGAPEAGGTASLNTYTSSSLSRSPQAGGAATPARLQSRNGGAPAGQGAPITKQRVQFLGPNGRQMLISSANYGDAGDYLCSWARLPTRAEPQDSDELGPDSARADAPTDSPLAEGSLQQLVAPVKLRPFKSAYHVREGNQLRLVCQVQRGYPAAHISWYVGNRLVDADFLREHANEFKILQVQARDTLQVGARMLFKASTAAGASEPAGEPNSASGATEEAQIVEINPIPAGRLQMQMTANGRGQWVEYKRLDSDKHAIDTQEHQARYLQMKLAQLTGVNVVLAQQQPAGGDQQAMVAPTASSSSPSASSLQQASLSVLVINKLTHDRHTLRYACRATSRANTDEVTTVIRVKGKW